MIFTIIACVGFFLSGYYFGRSRSLRRLADSYREAGELSLKARNTINEYIRKMRGI